MGVAGQRDEVLHARVADLCQDVGTLGRVTVPLVEIEQLDDVRPRVVAVVARGRLAFSTAEAIDRLS